MKWTEGVNMITNVTLGNFALGKFVRYAKRKYASTASVRCVDISIDFHLFISINSSSSPFQAILLLFCRLLPKKSFRQSFIHFPHNATFLRLTAQYIELVTCNKTSKAYSIPSTSLRWNEQQECTTIKLTVMEQKVFMEGLIMVSRAWNIL